MFRIAIIYRLNGAKHPTRFIVLFIVRYLSRIRWNTFTIVFESLSRQIQWRQFILFEVFFRVISSIDRVSHGVKIDVRYFTSYKYFKSINPYTTVSPNISRAMLSNPAGAQNSSCLGLCGRDICPKSYA